MAVAALFEMRTPAAIAALRLGLESSSTVIRISSVGALGRLRDADSVPVFARLAVSKNPEEARAGLLALGAVGSVESLAALRKATVEDSQKVARSWAIVAAASSVSGPDAVEAFKTLVSPSELLGVRLAAIRGLFPLDANVALELYLNLIREGDEGTRARAAGIAKVLPDSAFGPLARMFPDIAPETAAIFFEFAAGSGVGSADPLGGAWGQGGRPCRSRRCVGCGSTATLPMCPRCWRWRRVMVKWGRARLRR